MKCIAVHGGTVEGGVGFRDGNVVSEDAMERVEERDGFSLRFGCV